MRQSTDFGSTGTMMVGAVMALLAAAMMVWGSSDATAAVVLGVIGIVFIAVGSRDRWHSSH
jgi:hypothetical protein